MSEFSSEAPYIKQISIYFKANSYQDALNLSKEFRDNFPDKMFPHFLVAKSAFWLNEFGVAKEEAQIAFNLSKGQEELAVTGILLAAAYYRLKEYESGMRLLNLLKTQLPEKQEIAKLKFIFALALQDEAAALRHLETLYQINEEAANGLVVKILEHYV